MSLFISVTVRLTRNDVRALKRARDAGYCPSELLRQDPRIIASAFYSDRRPPSTRLFESGDPELGDESRIFRD